MKGVKLDADKEAKRVIMETIFQASKKDLDDVLAEVEERRAAREEQEEHEVEKFDPSYASIVKVPRYEPPRFPEPTEKIVMSVDELGDFIQKLESMKPAELKAALANLYGKNKMFEQWYNTVKSEWEKAVKSGASWVSIPTPPQLPAFDREDLGYYKEFFKLIAPFYLLNTISGQNQEQKATSITELTNAVKTLRDMVKEEEKKIKINVNGQEIEVEPELALMYHALFGGGQKSSQTDYVVIKDPDGSERHVPKDIYLIETFRELLKKTEKEKEQEHPQPDRLTSQLLSTVDKLTGTLNKLAERIEKLEEKVERKNSISTLLESVEALAKLKNQLDLIFGGKKDDSNDELIRMLLISEKGESKEKGIDIDLAMEKARQQGMYVERLISQQERQSEERQEEKSEQVKAEEVEEEGGED